MPADEVRRQDFVVRGHGADHQLVAFVADSPHSRGSAEVNYHVRIGQPEPEYGQEALPARQQFRIAGLGER